MAAEPQQAVTKQLIKEIDACSEWPTTGKVEGTLTLERIEKRGNTKLVRCDFRVWFDGDNLRVERDYERDRLKEEEIA